MKKNNQTFMEKKRVEKPKVFFAIKVAAMATLITYCFVIWVFIWCHQFNDWMLWSTTCLCFVCSFLIGNDFLILVGELSTIGADLFMEVIGGDLQFIGVIFFILTQFAYAAYFFIKDKIKLRKIIIGSIQGVLTIVGVLVVRFGMKSTDPFVILIGAYFPNIVINIIHAAIVKNKILFIGLIIFTLSDIVIGLNKLVPDGKFLDFLKMFSWIHLLYIPSQVIIACNTDRLKELKVNRYI